MKRVSKKKKILLIIWSKSVTLETTAVRLLDSKFKRVKKKNKDLFVLAAAELQKHK